MKCQETLSRLCEFVDSELDETVRTEVRAHLDGCPDCSRAYRHVASLKQLVQRKLFSPPLPGGLAGRILRNTRCQAEVRRVAGLHRRRRALAALAAILLLSATVWLITVNVFRHGQLLAHAEAIRGMHAEYRAIDEVPARRDCGDEAQILADIERQTGIRLERVPSIEKACLLTWKEVSIAGRTAVRLDYQDKRAANQSCPTSVISVFAVPVSEIELPQELVDNIEAVCPCECLRRSKNAPTVYCFRDSLTSLNLMSWVDQDEMRQRLLASHTAGPETR